MIPCNPQIIPKLFPERFQPSIDKNFEVYCNDHNPEWRPNLCLKMNSDPEMIARKDRQQGVYRTYPSVVT